MSRYCDSCKHDHGIFFVCDSYTDELKDNITIDSNSFAYALCDPAWIKKQMSNGVPAEVILINRVFAGIA